MAVVEVVYDTFPRTTTRAVCDGLLLKGLRLSTLKRDDHGGLRDSDRRSVIPYVHGRESCIVVCVPLFNVELNFR
jgi:hypothetical protein